MVKGARFLETFSGCGRFYDLYRKKKPTEVVMVDLNKHAINHIKDHLPGVKAICNDVVSWCRQEKGKFGVSIVFWGLCYL